MEGIWMILDRYKSDEVIVSSCVSMISLYLVPKTSSSLRVVQENFLQLEILYFIFCSNNSRGVVLSSK